MSILPETLIQSLHTSAISAWLDRTALLAGISSGFSQAIPAVSSPSAQILVDLHHINGAGVLTDGSVPLLTWLKNAARLTELRGEQSIFEVVHAEALEIVGTMKLEQVPRPNYRDPATRALGEQLERERARKKALESVGASTTFVNARILALRRQLREGGQLREGDSLGRYTLLQLIGRGGFAVVWKAFDPDRRALVAVKVLHGNLAGDVIRRERFARGARTMEGLDHPAIVRVLSPVAEDGGFHFFVMEHVDGEDLQRAVVNGRLPAQRALAVVLAIGEALALAHKRGLVHRDVKPANILLGPSGEPKLTDFDLVGTKDTTGGTRTGGGLGTFIYGAPESQERPHEADARADVYGLAMTAVFSLHGKPLQQTVLRDTDTFVEGLGCGAALKAVLKRALDWDRDKRFSDARALCTALEIAGQAERLKKVEPLSKVEPPSRRAMDLWTDEGEDAFGRFVRFSVNKVVQRMRWIPSGRFLMGSRESEAGRYGNEGPLHEVDLARGFWIADTPCTQALWYAVMRSSPSYFKGPDRPVESVSWEDCRCFFEKLATLLPWLGARLPREVEWERACRGGTSAATWAGELVIRGDYDAPVLDAIAWHGGNSGGSFELDSAFDSSGRSDGQPRDTRATRPVGTKVANPFGLFDMLGNVYEWCDDSYGTYAVDDTTDPHGFAAGSHRVIRGGAWSSAARSVRAARRHWSPPDAREAFLGFRLARDRAPSFDAKPRRGTLGGS